MLIVLSDPARRLTFALAESNTKLTATLVVATLLQTRVPTGKNRGPEVGLLLSRPITFQVRGVTVSAACAEKTGNSPATRVSTTILERTSKGNSPPVQQIQEKPSAPHGRLREKCGKTAQRGPNARVAALSLLPSVGDLHHLEDVPVGSGPPHLEEV